MPQKISIIFGKRVKEQRKKLGFSQEKLAEIASLHRNYIGLIERAEKNISLLNMQKIADALNVKITKLLQ